MKLSDVIGHASLKNRLVQMVKDNRISHALLLAGPEGSGNLPLALAYAQYLNCTQHTDDSCGTCPSCSKISRFIHPDLHFIFPVVNTASIAKAVSDDYLPAWRSALTENPYMNLGKWVEAIASDENKQSGIFERESDEIMRKLSLKTYEGEYKVMIIWMPEKMHMAASNKLLKLLEEPPATTVFLLVSEEPDKILPTILSRCQLIKVPAYTDEEIEIALKNKGFEDAQLKDIARIAKGNYRRALDLASSQNEKAALLEQFIKLMRLCYSFQDKKEESLKAIYKLNEDLAGMGRENQKKFLIYSLALLRDNFILNQQTPDLVYQMPDENNFSVKFNTFVNPRNIQGLYDEFNKAHYHIESNGNAKIVFLDLALKIITWIRK